MVCFLFHYCATKVRNVLPGKGLQALSGIFSSVVDLQGILHYRGSTTTCFAACYLGQA